MSQFEQQDGVGDSLENQLRELGEAERAGVFRSTPLPVASLVFESNLVVQSAIPRHYRNRAILAVAASVTLAFGVWTLMFVSQITDLKERTAMIDQAGPPARREPGSRFSSDCMTGPSETADDPCLSNDLDADGSVTLADFRAFQLAPAGSPQ